MPTDLTYMRRAVRIAERVLGQAAPNPTVGALVVAGGVVVGEGTHRRAGEPHAEVEALRAAGARARGATLYVTLAPCTRHGRTPPCAPAVIEAGIARVVVASLDPTPDEGETAIGTLRAAGIEVETGVLGPDADELIAGFTSRVRAGRPRVTLKLATSIDGRVAAADGSSRWITGPAARRDGHRLRASSGAVMIGIGTALADDPSLTCRLRGFTGAQPLRVVLDATARLPLGSKLLDGQAPTLVATTKATDEQERALRDAGAEVVRFPTRGGRVDVAAVLAELGARGVNDVLVEGGPTLAGELIDLRLADRYVFYIGAKLLGAAGLGAVSGLVAPNIGDARELTFTGVRRLGSDVRIDAKNRT